MIEPDTIASAHPEGFRLSELAVASSHVGTITAANLTFTADYVFHAGTAGELRLTREGMFYNGRFISDAGQAHSALMDALTSYKP